MNIRDFVDLQELESMQAAWSDATGMASIFTDAKGEYITGDYNFTDFCIQLTRGSKEGLKRCVDTDQHGLEKDGLLEGGCYRCHAGLMDFSYPIKLKETGEVVMVAIGGQVLPDDTEVDETTFRKIADEIGVDTEQYLEALSQVPRMSEEKIRANANLLYIIIRSEERRVGKEC